MSEHITLKKTLRSLNEWSILYNRVVNLTKKPKDKGYVRVSFSLSPRY